MSYISATQPAQLAVSVPARPMRAPAPVGTPPAYAPASPSSRLSTGLEIALLAMTLSSVSLVLCTIAAGAF